MNKQAKTFFWIGMFCYGVAAVGGIAAGVWVIYRILKMGVL